jgi:hypothetical protein
LSEDEDWEEISYYRRYATCDVGNINISAFHTKESKSWNFSVLQVS